jgi:transcriptional/translational regulatory protein YebC/TACO1
MAPTSYLFERKGLITLEPTPSNPSPTLDSLLDLSLDLGVEDVRESHSTSESETEAPSSSAETLTVTEFELVTPLNELSSISTALSSPRNMEDWTIRSAEMSYEAVEPVEVVAEGEEGEGIKEERVESLVKLVDSLEVEQDITQVWTNLAR